LLYRANRRNVSFSLTKLPVQGYLDVRKSFGLATKFSFGIALLVCASVGLTSILALIQSRESLRDQVLLGKLKVANLVAKALHQYVTDAANIMREAPGRPKLRKEIQDANWTEAEKVLKNFHHSFPQFDYVFIQDPAGIIRVRVPHAETVGQDFSFRKFFQEAIATRELHISEVYVSKAAARAVVSMAVPVVDAGQNVKGVIVGSLSLRRLKEFVSRIGGEEGGSLFVVDSKGVLLAHSGGREPGSLSDVYNELIVQAVLGGKTGTMEFTDTDSGESFLGAYTPVAGLGWGVVAMKPVAVAYRPLKFLGVWFLWIAVVCFAAAVILGWGLSRILTRPLREFSNAAQKLAAGDLTVRVARNTRDEVGILARSFNHMAERLQESYRELKTEVAERKQAEEEVRHLNADLERRVNERTLELQAVNKELEAFSYSVSHDLRAPLRSLDGFAQALVEDYRDRTLDAEGQDYLNRIRAASQRMAQLIDDMLNLARVTRRSMQVQSVDLSGLAKTIAAELRQAEPAREVEFHIPEGIIAQGDQRLLRVALENLLGNAWKFTGKCRSARVEFAVKQDNGTPVYEIRDNGAGFDMAYADKLFGAFQRLHAAGEFPGTGIGLATVQRVIHRHGGKIWAESAVGKGSAFYFTLRAADG
jgi:signal transduction histidine kinase